MAGSGASPGSAPTARRRSIPGPNRCGRQRVVRAEVVREGPRTEDEERAGTGHAGTIPPGRGSAAAGRCYHPAMDIVIVLVIVLVVVLIWRGPKTLPKLGKAFGQGVKEARQEIDGIKTDIDPEGRRRHGGTARPARGPAPSTTPPPPPPPAS